MHTDAPPFEQEGGSEQSDIRLIIDEAQKLCNEFAGERAELEVPMAEEQQLYIRYETVGHPRLSHKRAIICLQYRNNDSLVFTMYECTAQNINGKRTSQLYKSEGSVIGGATTVNDVTNTQEYEVPINWLKDAHNIMVNADNVEVV